ncbi:MAG: BTAD domain-containing putative transcriptional regulator [Micromonosporaceae bacterium]
MLGLVKLTVDGRSAPLTRSERSLLARLAVSEGRPVAVSVLAEWLWGDQPHASPRNRVQALVSGIRRKTTPGDEVVRTEGSSYRLASGVACDIAEWQQLRSQISRLTPASADWTVLVHRAAGLVDGTPLDGCLETELVEQKRAQLEEEALRVLGDRIEADIMTGNHADLAAELRSLTGQHPYDERLVGQLMRVLALTGRRAEALAVYRHTYQQVVDELGVPPSDVLTAIHRRILTDDIGPASGGPATGGVIPPAPRTVPRAVAEAIGRDSELAAIDAAAATGIRPAVVSLVGLPGVGKSTLAIESAHRLRDRFPDGSLYLDLDSETGRAGPCEVLALFLRLLGVSGLSIPEGHDARAALFRSVIDDKKILIVLDDVPDGFPVADLLPTTASSLAILTSRRPVTGAEPTLQLRLSSLTVGDSVALLRTLIGERRIAEAPAEAAELARTCGGLPLLLRVSGQRLAQRPDLSLSRAARALSDEIAGRAVPDDREATVLAGLGIVEASLPDATRVLLREVAGLPFPRASRWVFEALAADPGAGDPGAGDNGAGDPGAGEQALDQLVDAGLVDPVLHEGADPQYQLHDLVRLYARGSGEGGPAPYGPVRVVADRLLHLVAVHAAAFPAQLIPAPPDERGRPYDDPSGTPRPSPEEALRFFRTEYENVLITAREVAPTWPGLAWRLLALTGNHVHTALDPRLWISAAHDVVSGLPSSVPDGAQGRAYLSVVEALLRHEWAQSSAGIPMAAAAHRCLEQEQDTRGALVAAVVLGRGYRATGDRARAEAILSWADESCGPDTPASTAGYVRLAWGSLCNDYDRLQAALDHHQRAVSLFESTNDWSGLATAQRELGLVYRRLRRYPEGLPLYDSALSLFLRLGDRKGHTAVLDGRADLVTQMGEPARALPDATAAVRRSAQARDAFLLHRSQRTLGRVYTGLGRVAAAVATFRDSAAGFEALGRPLSLAATLRDLARLYESQGRAADARRILIRERECLRRAGVEDLHEVDLLIAGLDHGDRGRGAPARTGTPRRQWT